MNEDQETKRARHYDYTRVLTQANLASKGPVPPKPFSLAHSSHLEAEQGFIHAGTTAVLDSVSHL